MMKQKTCEHLENFTPQHRDKNYECAECIKTGDRWLHLRTCQSCGVTLCCDSSPNKHATAHFRSHPDHPVVISAEPGEQWAWCYQHETFAEYQS